LPTTAYAPGKALSDLARPSKPCNESRSEARRALSADGDCAGESGGRCVDCAGVGAEAQPIAKQIHNGK